MEEYVGGKIRRASGMNIPRFVYTKITRGVDPEKESRGLRAFRELLQNSDDAQATTLTLRFDKDRLYSHNDGFTIEHLFVDAISEILDSNKAQDPDTSGNFGSGFRSTYMFTDQPEMEWWDIEKEISCPSCGGSTRVSSSMPDFHPVSKEPLQTECSQCRKEHELPEYTASEPDPESPLLAHRAYGLPLGIKGDLDWVPLGEKHTRGYRRFGRELAEPVPTSYGATHSRLGVLFRYPWRRKNTHDGEPGWSNYCWTNKQAQELAQELREYAPVALIGCRHLTAIRIVMAGCAKEGERWDFVASRDTTVSDLKTGLEWDHEDLPDMTIHSITHDRTPAFFDVDKKGSWKRTDDTGHEWYDYRELIQEAEASPEASSLSYKAYAYDDGVDSELAEKLGFWDFQVLLLPLSPHAPKLPVYTPIPLAGSSSNHFAVISMLPPTEARLHIEVSEPGQKDWLKAHIDMAAEAYGEALVGHLECITERFQDQIDEADPEVLRDVEKIFVNCLPWDAPNRWFGTGGDLGSITRVDKEDKKGGTAFSRVSSAVRQASSREIALVNDTSSSFVPLSETIHHWYDPDDTRFDEILEAIEAPVLSEAWRDYFSEVRATSAPVFFEDVIEGTLLDRSKGGSRSPLSPKQFAEVVKSNWEKARDSNRLERASELLLEGICTNPLAEEWADSPRSVLRIPCVISQDGGLREIPEFIDTNKQPDLVHILPDIQLVEAGVREATIRTISESKLIPEVPESIEPTGTRILKLIDQDTRLNPEVHDDLESHEEVYLAVSKLLRAAFHNKYNVRNNLNDDEVRGLRFVPCRRHGRVVTLQNNIVDLKSAYGSSEPGTWNHGDLSSSKVEMGGLYHRDFIFAERTDSLDALPACITDRLRFLALHEDVVPNLVRKDVLNLNVVGAGNKMTNLVRTLLFEHELASVGLAATQPSLYREGELEKWLRHPPMHLGTAEIVCDSCRGLMKWTDDYSKYTDCTCDGCEEEQLDYRWHCADCNTDLCPACETTCFSDPIEDTELEAYLDRIRDDVYEPNEVKLQLLVSLLAPYGEKISSGLGLGDEVRDSVELVLGADGEWRTGSSYCLSLDPSLDNLIEDMAAVDEELASSLSEGVLKQLGVRDSLGPHAAKPAIEDRIDDEDALALLMLSLLSSEEDWSEGNDNDKEAWSELLDMAWIPTSGAGVLQPNHVLYPSEDHVALLGDAYTHFPPKSTWETLRQANHKARALDLGMRRKVDLGVLILAICGEHTSGNDVSVAVKELSSRLLKLSGAPEWSGLNWGPHDSVPGLELQLNDNTTINSEDGAWVTEGFDKAQALGQLFNDMEVVAIDQLSHVDRSTIEGIRELGILQAGPDWQEILQRLTEVETPELVEGLWGLLREYEDAPDWKERVAHASLFDGDSDVNFCLDGDVVVIHESILITNNPDEHSQAELDGRVRYYVEDGSIDEQWFELLGVERASKVKPGDTLRSLVGEVIDPSDDAQAARLAGAKALMPLCDDGFYAPVWADGEVEIVDLGESLAIHPGPDPNAILPQFRTFPIIHRAHGDPPSYVDWLDNLRHNNLTPFSDISSIHPEPVLEIYAVHSPLQDAIKQVMEALSKIHPSVFNDPSTAKVTCRIGRGGVPSYMTAEWEGEQIRILHSSSRSGCFYEEEEDELTMFVDEDDDHGNERSCSNDLVEGLLKTDWYPELSNLINRDGGFSSRLKNLIRSLLETPTDEWKYLELDGNDYGSMLEDDEWDAHSRLFESHSQHQMTQLLKGWYGGCQICGLVTPAGEYGYDTKESLIHTIRIRGSHYHGPTRPSRPRGRQLWVCPRHRILWGRRLVRFSFMDEAFDGGYVWRGTLPDDLREEGIGLLKEMRDNWEEGEGMMMEIFDQSVDGFGQAIEPQWNSNPMRVTRDHAVAILNEMIGWISS